MKNLLISLICLMILIVPWLMYDRYSTSVIGSFTETIKEETMPALEKQQWDSAEKSFLQIENDWQRFEKVSEYFLDTASVKEANRLFSKTKYHIIMRDADNAAAGSAELVDVLNSLHENETLTTGNVF